MARSLEKRAELTFQIVKVTPTTKLPAGAVGTVRPFLSLTNPTDQTNTDQAPLQQKQVPSMSAVILPHRPDSDCIHRKHPVDTLV